MCKCLPFFVDARAAQNRGLLQGKMGRLSGCKSALVFGGDLGHALRPATGLIFYWPKKLRKRRKGHLRGSGAPFPPCLASIDRRPTTAGCAEVRTAVPEHGLKHCEVLCHTRVTTAHATDGNIDNSAG